MEVLSDVRSLPDFLFGVLLLPAYKKEHFMPQLQPSLAFVLDTIGRVPIVT